MDANKLDWDLQGMALQRGTGRPDPTPDEIRAVCLEIQAGWTLGTRKRRCTCKPPAPWKPPELSLVDADPDESERWFYVL